MAHDFSPRLGRPKQRNLCDMKAIVTTARTPKRNPGSNQNKLGEAARARVEGYLLH